RNEGISRKHNPEFTMLEAYWAYADFEKIADLVEEMICHVAGAVIAMESGASPKPREPASESLHLQVEHRDIDGNATRTINLTRPWRRARYHDLVREAVGADWFEISGEQRRERAKKLGVEILPQLADFEVTQHVFEKLVEEKTFDPLFVTHCHKGLVPLAKLGRDRHELVDVYELIINGAEVCWCYSG